MNARDTALKLVEDELVDAQTLLMACLQYMSLDDVQDMLEANCFLEHDGEEESDGIDDEYAENPVVKYFVLDENGDTIHVVYFPESMSQEVIVEGLIEYEGYPKGISIERA